MIRPGGRYRAVGFVLLVSVCLLCSAGATAVALTAPTPVPPGPEIGGTVFAPGGTLTRRDPSTLEYLAGLLSNEALALTGNATPVGRGVTVTLAWHQISGVANENVTQGVTNDQGQYLLLLPPNTTGDTIRFVVSAGSGANVTRAFVTNQQPVDINFVTETVVALILARGEALLAKFSSTEIRDIELAVRSLPGTLSGSTAAQLNFQAYAIASTDFGITAMIDAAVGLVPTPTPTPLPTVNECNPSTPDSCSIGKTCNCCCGTWVCMPPYLPCCALACSEPTQLPTPTPVCGNGIVEVGEDCDDGGTCIGGSNAGTHCTAESDCIGNGVCIDGTHARAACASDAGCPGGVCVHCVPQGGDGCAANCTTETDVSYPLIPGVLDGLSVVAGTSGVATYSDFLSIPLPFGPTCNGGSHASYTCASDGDCPGGTCVQSQETLTIGKEKNGRIPVVVKLDSVKFPPIPVSTLQPGCIRGAVAKTCGGTFFESDGTTLPLDCTSGSTAGESVCTAAAKPPCAFVHGPGNTASGEIGCTGLDNINVSFSQNSGGVSGIAGPPIFTFSGNGGPGSASILSTLAITSGLTTAVGADGIFCTADDPLLGAVIATSPAVTGTATTVVHNANGSDGHDLGPVSVTGAPFSCAALAQGSAAGGGLAQAFTAVHLDTVGDVAGTGQFFAGTPLPPTTPTPTPPPSACVGDCNGSGSVTVDELITMVNIALGNASVSACPGVEQWCNEGDLGVIVTCIIEAVNNALEGCPGPTPTPAVSLDLRLVRTPGAVHITATLTNISDAPVFYLSGCSARCRPFMYQPVSFHLTGPDGSEVIVKSAEYPYPCSPPVLCPEFPQQISPGESLDEPLEIDGTAWQVDMSGGGYCGVCTAQPLIAGRYVVTATAEYGDATDTYFYHPVRQVERTVEFDWP